MIGKKNRGRCTLPTSLENISPHGDVPNFTVQGLRDALNEAESMMTEPQSLTEEFIIQLEVTMADQTGKAVTTSIFMEWGLGATCAEK